MGFNLWKMSTVVKRISRIYLLPARKHLTSFFNSSRHFCVSSLTSGLILRKREWSDTWILELAAWWCKVCAHSALLPASGPLFSLMHVGDKEERTLSRSFECLNWNFLCCFYSVIPLFWCLTLSLYLGPEPRTTWDKSHGKSQARWEGGGW